MYNLLKRELEKRQEPIRVCIVGCGWFGSGLIRELFRTPGLEPRVIITKTIDKAVSLYNNLGIDKQDIVVVNNPSDLTLISHNKYIVSPNLDLIKYLGDIDVVYEATGDILAGAQSAMNSFEISKPFVTINFEMDSLIGLILSRIANEKGLMYSCSDGDQPGVLARMIHEITAWGFKPKISGSCKGFLDYYQTPKGVEPFVPSNQDIKKICSFADGSKQSCEMVSLGNAFGFFPLKRGMYGPKTISKQELIRTFFSVMDLDSKENSYVDFIMGLDGVDQGAGVFIIAHKEGPGVKEDLRYLKKGLGPYYLFFRDHHLCYLEAISSIAEAVLFKIPTFHSKGRFSDVIAIAKRDLEGGKRLDGIGGYDCYGLIEKVDITSKENLLPLGLAEYATLKQSIPKDTPITYDMVELDDNLVVRLRKEQDKLPISRE